MTEMFEIDDAPPKTAVSLSDAKIISILRVDNAALEEGQALLQRQIDVLIDQLSHVTRGKIHFENGCASLEKENAELLSEQGELLGEIASLMRENAADHGTIDYHDLKEWDQLIVLNEDHGSWDEVGEDEIIFKDRLAKEEAESDNYWAQHGEEE